MADLLGTGPQTSTTTTNLGFTTPYYDRLANAAESQAQTPYTPYGGQRVAQSSPLQTQAYQQASGMGTSPAFQQAANLFGQTAQTGQGLSAFQPNQISSTFQPTAFNSGYSAGGFNPGYTAPSADEYSRAANYQSGGIQSIYNPSQFSQQDFGSGQAQRYMNPYQQAVTDIQRREAERKFGSDQSALRASAAQRGAFGGSRATLLESEAQRNQNELLDDISQKGLSSAFQNAQQQFNTDRQRRLAVEQAQEQAYQTAGQMGMSAQQANESARLAGAQFGLQGVNAREQARQQQGQMGLQAQQLGEQARQQQGQMGLQAQQFGEQSKQFGAQNALNNFQANEAARQQAANLMLQGNQQALGAAQGLSGLGAQMTSSEINRINQLADLGNQMRGVQQQGLDVDYQNFTDQRDYGKKQLEFLSSILGRVPAASQTTQSAPGANLLGQLANLGIGGYSLYQLLNGVSGNGR